MEFLAATPESFEIYEVSWLWIIRSKFWNKSTPRKPFPPASFNVSNWVCARKQRQRASTCSSHPLSSQASLISRRTNVSMNGKPHKKDTPFETRPAL